MTTLTQLEELDQLNPTGGYGAQLDLARALLERGHQEDHSVSAASAAPHVHSGEWRGLLEEIEVADQLATKLAHDQIHAGRDPSWTCPDC